MTYKEGDNELSLWNEEDGMYYDAILFGPGNSMQLPVSSLVGLVPLYATLVLEPSVINRFPGFKKRMEWFLDNRPEVSARNMANMKGLSRSRLHWAPPSVSSADERRYDDFSRWKGRTPTIGASQQGASCQNPRENAR